MDKKRQKFYSKQSWRKFSKQRLKHNPLCVNCLKQRKLTVATVTDHLDPTWSGGTEFFKGPFQSLCRDCHILKTAGDDLIIKKTKIKFF